MGLGEDDNEDDEPFQLTGSASEQATAEQPTRPGQSQFKFKLLKRYGPRFAVCDVDVAVMLDACHIRGKEHQGSDHPGNGLVLCANHHRAFDRGLFAIEPRSLAVKTKGRRSAEEIGLTKASLAHLERPPHPKSLQWHWAQWENA